MFKSRQYRAKAAQYGERVKSSANADESRKYQGLENRFVALANNERDLAVAYHDAVHIDESGRARGEVLAAEEEQGLRCLGAAIIMLALLITQLCLGFTAFLTRVAWGRSAVQPELPMVVATVSHVAVGALLLATTVVLAIQVWRHVPVAFE